MKQKLFMRYFSKKLFKWNFSEENVGNKSEKIVRMFTLLSNEDAV